MCDAAGFSPQIRKVTGDVTYWLPLKIGPSNPEYEDKRIAYFIKPLLVYALSAIHYRNSIWKNMQEDHNLNGL